MTAHQVELGQYRLDTRVRWTLSTGAALVLAFVVFLIVRRTGSYSTPVDGWGVDLFELSMGVICIGRYFEPSWRSSHSTAKSFPLILGVACLSWGLGDVSRTVESLGGTTPPVPSAADGFYLGFFPLCYLSFMLLIRRGNRKSLVATSLDGLIAGLGIATLSAEYVFRVVMNAAGGGALSAATNLAYPVGDLLLLALAVGGLAVLAKEYRPFFALASVAMPLNATGDLFNLLQPNSKPGYVANAVVWPISLLMLAIATWIQPAKTEKQSAEKNAGFLLPTLGALAGLSVLLSASIGHEVKTAVGLATGTLFVAGIRMALTVREAQALRSARFRSLIDKAWDIIVVSENDFRVAYITPSSERVLGYAPSELEGKPITELVHPDDEGVMLLGLGRLTEAMTETSAFETRMRRRNGAWRTISWTATNLLADPSVRGYVLNGGDVTEARQAAEDLAAARDGALMASKAKSQFLSMMSHEIRTPMNGVIGLTELLLATRLDHEQHELAVGVKGSAENLLVIINDILDFPKVEAGKLELEESDVNVADVIDDVGRIVASAAHNKGIELLVDVQPDVPTRLLGDGVRIRQVLLNLVSNAVKFTFEGEVVVRVSVVKQNSERVALRFDVIDMGIGIAPQDQERLFHAFAQADVSTTRRFGGTGLGLAISRQLVELMGGDLALVSAPGEGSTFWFELSLRRSDSTPSQRATLDRSSLAGQRALVVDDNATNRRILRQQLLSWGIEAFEATDAYEALGLVSGEAQAGQAFDLGVIDLNMPGMDGIELADILKGDPETAPMTLILLSSSGERLSAAECHLRGFAASLTKPIRSSELYDCLITSLNHTQVPTASVEPETGGTETGEVMGMILLVEDNKMNQLVGSKVLEKLGYEFDIANNGLEALSAARSRRYDAVLMDCQMPEMDGYEATAEIRRLEGSDRHTPIIAMTAAAMDGDREVCIAAGMDDYLSKPVRLEAVAEVLQRWVARPAPEGGADEFAMLPEALVSDALDRSQIKLLRSLDDGEDRVLGEVIEQYLAQTTAGRREIEQTVVKGDTPALERTAHQLRGASANVGAHALAAVCAELEMVARCAQLESAAGLVKRFDAEFARVRDALSELNARA